MSPRYRATSAALVITLTLARGSVSIARAEAPAAPQATQPDLLGLGDDTDRVTLQEQAHFGVATAPFEVRPLAQAKGQAFSFVTGGWLRIDDVGWVGLRLPVVAGSVAQPAGSYVDEAAWGNPELRAATRLALVDRDGLRLRLAAGAGVGVPLAEHATSLLPNRVLAVANGIEGLAEPELFRPGRLPVTAFGQVDAVSGRWRILGMLKVPVLVRVSGADLPSGESESRAAGVAAVARVEGRVSITRAFGLALSPQVFVDVLPAAVHVRETAPVQLLLRGGPFFQVSSWGSIAIDVQAPLGGPLGGSTIGGGCRLGVSL